MPSTMASTVVALSVKVNSTEHTPEDRSPLAQAEHVMADVGRVTRRAVVLGAAVGLRLLHRAREVAEDVWAEANAMSHASGEPSPGREPAGSASERDEGRGGKQGARPRS